MKRSKAIISLFLAILLVACMVPSWTVFALNQCTLTVNTVSAIPGETVNVDINIADNPGILGGTLTVSFDEGLELVGAKSGEAFSPLVMTKPGQFVSPCKFTWDGQEINPEDIKDGTILTLTFKISDSAVAGKTLNISAICNNNDFVDNNLVPVDVLIVSGGITVVNYTPGDVNNDGNVNATDIITLRRYIAGGYGVSIVEEAANVNGDNAINATDIIWLRRCIAGGYGIEPLPSPILCGHDNLVATEAHPATCTEDGNIAYWYCSDCGRYFSDAKATKQITLSDTVEKAKGHTVVIDPYVAPTYEQSGLTEGKHCSVCHEIITPQTEIPPLVKDTYNIVYHLSTNDEYLRSINIENPNPAVYSSQDGIKLQNLSVEGYIFDGWYDGEGANAYLVKEIAKGETGDKHLYAHWRLVEYTITFDSPLVPVESKTYTVNKGATLSEPSLGGYNFMGWSMDYDIVTPYFTRTKEKVVTYIPVGTTGNITLHANWTSKRNQTRPVSKLEDPIIVEDSDNGTLLFTYEIGTIENVPLAQLSQTYNAVKGLKQTYTTSGTTSITDTSAKTIANSIANATTNSASWTLSSDWNKVTSVSETVLNQEQITREEAETRAKTSSNTYSLNSSYGGSCTNTNESGYSSKLSSSNNASYTTEKETGHNFELSANVGIPISAVNVGIGAKYGYSTKTKETGTSGYSNTAEINASHNTASSSTASFNSSSGYSSSNSVSNTETVSNSISNLVAKTKGYGEEYAEGGSNSESKALTTAETKTDQYTSALTYSTTETVTETQTFEFGGESEGYYRVIQAGTAHVFAVVGYDIPTASYFVYTYTVMDDHTYSFVDYSKTTAKFDDEENGVLPFEVPYAVNEYVASRTLKTDGLKINTDTGVIEGYTGTDTLVYVPAYMSVPNIDGNGKPGAVKVTGISTNAFKGRNDIVAVSLPDTVSEIPDSAFEGCSSLVEIILPGVIKIGKNAFKGCSSLLEFTVPADVTQLGENAFYGVPTVNIAASTAEVAMNGCNSGAGHITLNIASIENCSGLTLNVPETTEYFELQGGNKVYTNLRLNSKAQTTVLNGLTISDCTRIPLEIASENLELNGVIVKSSGFALLLSAETTNISLYRTSSIETNGKAMVCQNLNLSESSSTVSGKLYVSGNVYMCGDVKSGSSLLTVEDGSIIKITIEEYAKYMNGVFTITFNAPDAISCPDPITAFSGFEVGKLPKVSRDYYNFDGWYTKPENESYKTVWHYSRGISGPSGWNNYTVKISPSYTLNYWQEITLDYPLEYDSVRSKWKGYYFEEYDCPYWFNEWTETVPVYSEDSGELVTESTVFDTIEDITLYAHWVEKESSDWVLASERELPENAEIIDEKYTYTQRDYTASGNSNLGDNWVKYDTQRTGWGPTQGAVYYDPQNGVRNVWSEGYVICDHYKTVWHYSRGITGPSGWNDYAVAIHPSYALNYWQEITLDYPLEFVGNWTSQSVVNEPRWKGYYHDGFDCPYWFNEWSESVYAWTEYGTRWYYQDPVYTYYYYKDLAKESSTDPTGLSNISDVKHYIKYRIK